MKIGDITANYITDLLNTGVSLGLDADQLLNDIGLSCKELRDSDNRIDLVYLMRLGHTIIQRTGHADLGLIAATTTSITRYGYAGLAALTAPTLGEALQNLVRFEALYGRCYRGNSRLVRNASGATLNFYSIAPYNDYTYFVVDTVLCSWARVIYWLTGRTNLVQSAHIEFSTPSYYTAYPEAFGCPVQFHQECNHLLLAPGATEVPVVHANASLHEQLVRECEAQMSRISLANTYRNRVQRVLGTMLHGKTPSIEEVAQELGIPSWTLRRKLNDEEASFQEIVDEMRRDVALSYMRNTELSFGEISYLLGFSTPGAFQRAFKRWAGSTPGEYRRHLQEKSQRF